MSQRGLEEPWGDPKTAVAPHERLAYLKGLPQGDRIFYFRI
ncbi:MAG: hypothetical protein V7K88_11690 [Nostoc sp.]